MSPSMPQIKAFIIANMPIFQPGCEFDETFITEFAEIPTPRMSRSIVQTRKNLSDYQFAKMSIQNKFNRRLAKVGMYMSQYQYTKWRIKERREIPERITKFQRQSSKKAYRGAELTIGFQRYGCVLNRTTASAL